MGLFDKVKASLDETMRELELDKLGMSFSPVNEPPPLPAEHKPGLKVMVVVDGKPVGPFDESELADLIDDEELTSHSYVFIEGMKDWQRAGDVAALAPLFKTAEDAAPVLPPLPSEASAGTSLFSARLNSLIDAAVADGEISEMERGVLVRRAQEEGVAMDEFVMVLEARLYEKSRELAARREHEAPTAPVAAPATPKKAGAEKCPACGALVKALATCCPECGYEYRADAQSECAAWERLNRMLEAVDKEKDTSLMGRYMSLMGAGSMSYEKIEKKKNIIRIFPIPSDKRSILDFFVSCATLAQNDSFFERDELARAYKTKAKQVLVKARVVMKDDPKMLEEINEIAKRFKIKA